MDAWILTGDEANWIQTLGSQAIWGVRQKLEKTWESVQPGDPVYFYCKSPVAAVIGFGRAGKRFRQNRPFWPDEVSAHRVIYPYRFEFDIDFVLPRERWATKGAKASILGLTRHSIGSGLNRLRDETLARRIQKTLATRRREEYRARDLTHKGVQRMLHDIGKLQRFVSDMEYPMEGQRLDVVWRRLERSVPTYVFEVQVGGDVEHALGKLKHAHDLWNSELFLALSDRDEMKASSLLSGTFHEIKDQVKRLRLDDIRCLYEKKREWKEFEEELGIF